MRHGLRGTPFIKLLKVGMPRIAQSLLDTTFYLYPSREAAERGESSGGTGFLVGYVPRNWIVHFPHVYAVTNYHVAVAGGCPVVRINTHDGKTDIFELDNSDWHFVPDGHDIAIAHLPLRPDVQKFNVIPSQMFTSREDLRFDQIGAGDDVFMVGRFIDHDGDTTNQPALRFGHISVMLTHIYLEELKRKCECYCIDLHSRTGFSGSPVFVYRVFGQDLVGEPVKELIQKLQMDGDAPFWFYKKVFSLLGIHIGQFPEEWPIESSDPSVANKSPEHVVGMSGMTIVAPAWAIDEVLELPAVQKERQALEPAREELARELKKLPKLENF
jgi:hypothetical protein